MINLSTEFGLADLNGQFQPRATQPGLPHPAKQAGFAFKSEITRKMIRFFAGQAARNNMLLMGPAGCGKTALIEQTAARLGWPVWAVSCSGKVRTSTWLGGMALTDGSTHWQDGPLLLALRHGGVFLADEVTRLEASEQMALVRILDGGSFVVPETGETIVPHRLFRFVATGNSGGHGDASGAYAGERISSVAFLDRFIRLQVSYLSEEQEGALIRAAAPSLPDLAVKAVLSLASAVRAQTADGGLRICASTRSIMAFAREIEGYTKMGLHEPALQALNDTILGGVPPEEAEAVRILWKRFLD